MLKEKRQNSLKDAMVTALKADLAKLQAGLTIDQEKIAKKRKPKVTKRAVVSRKEVSIDTVEPPVPDYLQV